VLPLGSHTAYERGRRSCRSSQAALHSGTVSRDLSIALAGISLPILGALMARGEQTRASLRHHWWNMVRLWAAIAALVVSTVGGAIVLGDKNGGDPAEAFVLGQALGVTWGLMYAVYPLLVDVTDDLRQMTPKRLWRPLTKAGSILTLIAVVVIVFVAASAWWHGVISLVILFGIVPPLVMLWQEKARPALVRRFADEPEK
jgi:hypothetical protein